MSAPSGGAGGRAAVFLDRDGTLIEDGDYLADPEGVVAIPGATEAMRRLSDAGYALVVVTNQSGIARGRFTEGDYRRVAARVDELLAEGGVALDATLYCPHHPDESGPCGCRKPAPGMLIAAIDALGLDPSRSWMVGDKRSDLEAGAAVGARPLLVRTGYGREEEHGGPLPRGSLVAESLPEAVDRILAERVDPSGTVG